MTGSTDVEDERMLSAGRIRRGVGLLVARVRGGDFGSLPVIVGLVIIWTIFQSLNPVFLSSKNLVNLTMQCAAVGTIALGVVLVLLVGRSTCRSDRSPVSRRRSSR